MIPFLIQYQVRPKKNGNTCSFFKFKLLAGPQDDDEFDREFELSVFGGPTAFTAKEDENPRTIQQPASSATQKAPGSASMDVGENVRTHSSKVEEASTIKDSAPAAEANHSGNGISKQPTRCDRSCSISSRPATLCS